MRILLIDIDTLRPDHLGCYGYHRPTSPNIDHVAAEGMRLDNCYVPDAPCLPSRSALWSGRFGIHTGVINHGGTAANPFIEGEGRAFRDVYDRTGWIPEIKRAGLRPVTVSPFGERHSAWWWYAGWSEIYNPGEGGMEIADAVTPLALDWLERNAQTDNWFLHINYWDPHTPYRTPMEYGNPFEQDPLPAWLTEEFRQSCWDGFGPHSAQEPYYDHNPSGWLEKYPRIPQQIDDMQAVRQWIDGYDTGIWYADRHFGFLLEALRRHGIYEDTVIIITSDHGENQGELNIWGDHQTADPITCRVPLIIRWPGITPASSLDIGLHYNFDWSATVLELLGRQVPPNWDGQPFTSTLKGGESQGRDYLVLSQGAWACQRGVRFTHQGEDFICLRTYHDGYKQLEPVMLFNLTLDPHEQNDLAAELPALTDHALALLDQWHSEMMATSTTNTDPMMTVMREGGPFHTRGTLTWYANRLRATGRVAHADRLERLHPQEK